LWSEPLDAQLARAFAGESREAEGLLFTRGEVVGAAGDALVVAIDAGDRAPAVVRFVAPLDHELLSYRENLRLLSRAPGLRFDLVGRVVGNRFRTAALLAVGPLNGGEDRPTLRLPESWSGRCNVGLDRLARSYFSSAEREVVALSLADVPDPLEALRRRLLRMALGGRSTLGAGTVAMVEHDAALLERRMMPRAAASLRALGEAACAAERSATGARRAGDAGALANAWADAFARERASTRFLRRASWGVG